MNTRIPLCAALIIMAGPVLAGGGSCRFKEEGLPVLNGSPVMEKIITTNFTVENGGSMGPMNAPFDGSRRYTYMDFQATATADRERRFIIRIHFKSNGGRALDRVEFIPLEAAGK